MNKQTFTSLGAGPFEFPISGTFVVSNDGGATVFETPDESRRYYLGSFRNIAAHGATDTETQLAKLEQVVRSSWESFAKSESGKVVVPFNRTKAGTLAVFSMATEFLVAGQVQYYVQFAISNGPRFASLFAEGLGPALPVHKELLPVMLRAKVTNGA